ncbi:hypothetical protein [Prosthecochloris sp. HL-130-GSB]|uniref:hypothetical protein n=1 Tax=Prosthecochloris sp. HL-130-GSB TaxID=1974213 RepID=UPI000A1C0F09|nr:hypothetical protein [Prosthecochloris sp. HL-130-GSB]ARM31745.1 hypothetical protein B9H02_11145 [Prosthecochloris sp. HL-130-GSB]
MIDQVQKRIPAERVASAAKAGVLKAGAVVSSTLDTYTSSLKHRVTSNRAQAPFASQGRQFGSLLRPRMFVFLIAGTLVFALYINNILTINSLSASNEVLRDRIANSRSVNAALELRIEERQTIGRITQKAAELGLYESSVAAVELVYEDERL